MVYVGMTTKTPVNHLSDRALLQETVTLAAGERGATVELIAALAEVDARRLYLGEGFSSLFMYCTHVLHLSEHAAYGRIEAARAARKFPHILELLAEGALTLTAVTLLAPHLTADNATHVLDAARFKTKREVEEVVAATRPQPDVVASVIAPIAPERYKVQLTVGRETHAKLRRAQDLLRHSIPTGDPAEIFDRALTLLVEHLEKQKYAATTKAHSAVTSPRSSRHIPATVRRKVWKRDGGQCAFMGSAGRCSERGFLEFHHVVPFAAGGAADVENIQLRCRSHNGFEAELFFTCDAVRERGRAYEVELGPGPSSQPPPAHF
jgi:hypothetical protein